MILKALTWAWPRWGGGDSGEGGSAGSRGVVLGWIRARRGAFRGPKGVGSARSVFPPNRSLARVARSPKCFNFANKNQQHIFSVMW